MGWISWRLCDPGPGRGAGGAGRCALSALRRVVKAISYKSHAEFGTIKTLFDLSMVLSAIVVSVLCLGHISGLRRARS